MQNSNGQETDSGGIENDSSVTQPLIIKKIEYNNAPNNATTTTTSGLAQQGEFQNTIAEIHRAAAQVAVTKPSTPPPPPPLHALVSGGGKKLDSASQSPFSSRPTSRTGSPTNSDLSDDLPTNVSTPEQLKNLPPECLSGDPIRPLRHVDEQENVSFHALQPMTYSVIFILIVELLERFCFYGINYTQTSYLTGAYDEDWNAGMSAVPASTYVSISVAVAYTSPFVGAFLSDSVVGEYWGLILGSTCFYIPGLFIIAATTIPGFLGEDFNKAALSFGLLFLWPFGTGIVKSIVNVFGAKQFHPLLQSSLIEAYYVKFYMCINIGALIGGVMVPLMAQKNVTEAYFIPVFMLSMAVIIFASGTKRYVIGKPKGTTDFNFFSKKVASGGPLIPTAETIGLFTIFRISLLVVPFNIAYSQMATTFIVQGTVMEKACGFIDAACMNNADAVAVLFFGWLIGDKIYPWLADRNIKIPTTYKFSIGSALGALALLWALIVEHMIRNEFLSTGRKINIMWQSISYILIGAGEIFAVSAAYEVAFTAAPPEKKVLASALNLFCVGGLPNVFCIALYQACSGWFLNSRGTSSISHLKDYSSAHVDNYFWLLIAISIGGTLVNLIPQVRKFVESIEEKAVDLMKSPKTPSRPPRRERSAVEDSPLLRVKRHQAYLKYGSGPSLVKQGSMRAGPFMSKDKSKSQRNVKRSMIGKMYKSESAMRSPAGGLVKRPFLTSQGKPMLAGAFLKSPKRVGGGGATCTSNMNYEGQANIPRSNSGLL